MWNSPLVLCTEVPGQARYLGRYLGMHAKNPRTCSLFGEYYKAHSPQAEALGTLKISHPVIWARCLGEPPYTPCRCSVLTSSSQLDLAVKLLVDTPALSGPGLRKPIPAKGSLINCTMYQGGLSIPGSSKEASNLLLGTFQVALLHPSFRGPTVTIPIGIITTSASASLPLLVILLVGFFLKTHQHWIWDKFPKD